MPNAIFLDRDGTINEEVNYLTRIQQIKIFPYTKTALQKLKSLGFLNIIVTNQSGVARGYITEKDLEEIHNIFRKELNSEDEILIDDIYYSPYHIDGIIDAYRTESEDRKPKTGMILKAQKKYNINLEESFFIGDSFTDMKCAANSGIKKILVKTGCGINDFKKCIEEKIKIDYFADDLLDAALFIEKMNSDRSWKKF